MKADEIRSLMNASIGPVPADAEDLGVLMLGEIAAQLAEMNQKLADPVTVTMDGGDFLVVRVQS